jgi:hypothetical protein
MSDTSGRCNYPVGSWANRQPCKNGLPCPAHGLLGIPNPWPDDEDDIGRGSDDA